MNELLQKPGARNDRSGKNDRKILLLAASSLFIFGGFLGCAVYRLLGIGESELYDKLIERYFLALFYKCSSPFDVLRVVLDCFLNEAVAALAIFFGGFTLFTGGISAVLLLWRGILFGFSLTMLEFSSKSGLVLDSICFLGAKFAVSMLIAVMAAEAFIHFYPERSPKLRSAKTKNYILVFLRVIGLIFADVCLMLFLIYVYI